MSGCSIKYREKILRENAFESKKKKLGLRFDPGKVLVFLLFFFAKIILVLSFKLILFVRTLNSCFFRAVL